MEFIPTVFLTWLILESIFFTIFYYIHFSSIYDKLSEMRSNEYLNFNSSARAFGSGMVRRKDRIGVDNAISPEECEKRANKVLSIPDKYLKIRALFIIYVMALIPSVVLTICVVSIMYK